jgi:uncharacterized protein YbjT (DUF2867 family)
VKVLIFGASGMVGQGVLRECLAAHDTSQVTVISRGDSPLGEPKLRHIVHADLFDLRPIENQLQGLDACFFCIGVSAAGQTEAEYRRLTYDLTMAVARTLAGVSPAMTFIYVSGAGTDSSERGSSMWARVKGKTENDLQTLSIARVCLFRPGVIQPLHGIRSKTRSYRIFYTLTRPLLPLARMLFPNAVITTEEVGRAMLNAVRHRASGVFEARDIARLARDPQGS